MYTVVLHLHILTSVDLSRIAGRIDLHRGTLLVCLQVALAVVAPCHSTTGWVGKALSGTIFKGGAGNELGVKDVTPSKVCLGLFCPGNCSEPLRIHE